MKKILFVVALVAVASLTASAADVREYGVPTRVEGLNAPHGFTQYQEPKNLKKIYSNLGPKSDLFYYADGWLIEGPSSGLGHIQWIGYPVTLKKAATVTQIRAAVFEYSSYGTGNDFNFGIWSDSSGVPGKEIVGRNKAGVANCDLCNDILVTVNIKPTQLEANTQYWMVITNAKRAPDASGAWNFDYNTTTGTQAYDLGSGWSTENAYVSAFAWYGK